MTIKIICRDWKDQYLDMDYVPRIGEYIMTPEGTVDHEFKVISVVYDFTKGRHITIKCDLYYIGEE